MSSSHNIFTSILSFCFSINLYAQTPSLKIAPNPLDTISSHKVVLSALGGKAPYTYTTNIGSVFMNGTSVNFIPPESGSGMITVTDALGAKATTPVNVYPVLRINNADIALTSGQVFTIAPTGGKLPLKFTKNSGNGILNGAIFSAPLGNDISYVSAVDGLGQIVRLKLTTSAATTCPNPIAKSDANIGVSFNFFKVSSGTQSQCEAAEVTSTCESTGEFSPALTGGYAACSVLLPPVINFLDINKLTFTDGEPVTLSWSTDNSTNLKIDPGAINVTGKTSQVVYPTVATEYILSAANSVQTVTAKRSVIPNKILDGNGISLNLANQCSLNTINDYMEIMTYNNRRIEPADCSIVKISTPVFSWVKPLDMVTTVPMTFVLTRLSDNYVYNIKTATTRLLLPFELTQGMYEWAIKYTNKSNTVITSAPRKFLIASSNQFAIPSGVAIANKIALKSHPRALPTGRTIEEVFFAASTGEYKLSFDKYLKMANTAMNTAIPGIPKDFKVSDYPPNSTEYAALLIQLKNKSIDESLVIETLGYAAKFTKNSKYKIAGINHLMALAAWHAEPESATSEYIQDQANREIFLSLAQGLDLFQDALTVDQRKIIVTSLRKRLKQTMDKFPGFDRDPYDSHLLTCVQYATHALMYVVGTPEFPESRQLLASAWENLMTNSGAWGGGNDGGYGNGNSYGWYTTLSTVNVLAATRLIADLDLTKWPVYGNVGVNQIAFYPAGIKMRGQFGDELEIDNHYFSYTRDGFRLLAKLSGRQDYEWYWRAFPDNVAYSGELKPFHYLTSVMSSNIPEVAPHIPSNFLFEDAGYVAFHTQTTDSLRSSLFFRSSRFGSFNHSHADSNAFTFVSKGKELFISGGYYPSSGTPHHLLVNRATRFKNALTFNGGIGQGEPVFSPTAPGAPVNNMDARGKLINYSNTVNWGLTTGDATLAYRGRNPVTGAWNPLLTNAIRSVAYSKSDGVVIIYDYATSSANRLWELNFQSLNLPELINANKTVKISNLGSNACLEVYGPPGSFKISNGFPIAPETSRPDQFHTAFKAATASPQLVSVTVIRESCNSLPVNVSITGTRAFIIVNGKYLMADKKLLQAN